jgi:hypothetical protein
MKKMKKVIWTNNKNKRQTTICEMNLPGNIEGHNRKNRGNARDRMVVRHYREAQKRKEQGDEVVGELLAESRVLEHCNKKVNKVNEIVAEVVGYESPQVKLPLGVDYEGKRCNNNNMKTKTGTGTIYCLDTIDDDEVHSCTGFSSLASLIAFIVVLSNGDMEEMTKTTTSLTWFEEWFLYFERIWGKRITRWTDCKQKYKISQRTCRRIFDNKLNIQMKVRRKWPRFATLDEDLRLRKTKWSEHFADKRLIMWDNTNVQIPKPSLAEAQRLTYSAYYGGNVGKGSVFIQPCGWMGTGELWMGAVSDSEYMERSQILEYQNMYLPLYDDTKKDSTWNIILDKGYRINTAAMRCGKQTIIQPSFARSDRRFTSTEMIRSAAIAADRAGNERAVRYAKMCGYLRSGLKQNGNVDRLSDVWLAWGFQANFMFRSVH